jgi:hypothetical protein
VRIVFPDLFFDRLVVHFRASLNFDGRT